MFGGNRSEEIDRFFGIIGKSVEDNRHKVITPLVILPTQTAQTCVIVAVWLFLIFFN